MPFQQSVRFQQAAGLPGEVAADGPHRSTTFRLIASTATPAATLTFGRVFGYSTPSEVSNPNGLAAIGVAEPGGSNFAGVLINPKEHVAYGTTAGGPLGATYSLPPESWGELCTMGIIFAIVIAADAAAGVPNASLAYNASGQIVSFVGALPANTTLIPGARLVTALGAAPAGGLAKIELTTIGLGVTA